MPDEDDPFKGIPTTRELKHGSENDDGKFSKRHEESAPPARRERQPEREGSQEED